ncbi:MAG: hypothetical protein AAF431_17065 [Pseudomonadota bacterium]
MLNSLTVFLAFLAFLAFGYLSLIRILYRHLFSTGYQELRRGISSSQGLKHIGSSAFFVSLPATSLLLFWGWGPALLWLIVFHLLADSLVNLQVTAVEHQSALSEYLVGSDQPAVSFIMRALLQVFLVLLLAIVLTMLAKLIDKESGLLFALVGLIPAYRILRSGHSAVPRVLNQFAALAMLILGFVFANELGFAIYGDWAFAGEYLDWLRFNNSTVLAAILLVGGFTLADNKAFSDDVARLAGAVIIITIITLTVKLVWLQPGLDAPLNSTQVSAEELPSFLSFCLFLFAGLSTLFFRVFNSTASSDTEEPSAAADFGRVQAESLLQLFLAVLLVLSLASALGIGAWKTHYLNWVEQPGFAGHLNLAIDSLLYLIHSGATAGNFAHTVIMAGFCIAGLNFLRVCIKALSLAEEETVQRVGEGEGFLRVLVRSKLLQAITAFVISCYFIDNGIALNAWYLVGIISWLVVMQLIVAMTVTMREASFARLAFGTQCLILIGLGAIQTIWISSRWAMDGDLFYAGAGFGLLLIGLFLWWQPIREIIARFGKTEDKPLFKVR